MGSPIDEDQDYGFGVSMVIPLLGGTEKDRLVAALYESKRCGGVISGGQTLRVFVVESDEAHARATVLELVTEVANELGLKSELQDMEVFDVKRHQRSPDRPRRITAPSVDYTRIQLPDGRTLLANQEGPLENWIVCLSDARSTAISGRDLLSVLSRLLQLPSGKKDDWVLAIVDELIGHHTDAGVRYRCPCCDHLTLTEAPSGTFALCPVCLWEDCNVQFADPDYKGGPNGPSLRQARANFADFGASTERRKQRVRDPRPGE